MVYTLLTENPNFELNLARANMRLVDFKVFERVPVIWASCGEKYNY